MGGYSFKRQGNFRAEAEGVGSYGSAATTAAGDFVEITTGSPGITFKESFKEVDTLTPGRGGQEPVKVDEDITYNYTSRFRAYTVPSTDDSTRPRNWNPIALGGGFLQSYDDNGGGGPYKRIYTLKDWAEAMDSITLEDERLQGTGTNSTKKVVTGGRHNIKISARRGEEILIGFEGAGSGYTFSDKGSGVNNDATPTGQILTFFGSTLTLTNIGATLAYSGICEAFEFDMKMRVVVIKSGTTSGGLIEEVLLVPTEAMMWSLTIQKKLLASFNAEKVRTDKTILTGNLAIPDPSDSSNVLDFDWDGRIVDTEEVVIEEDVEAYKINGITLWPHASAPGVTFTDTFTTTFTTTP